LRVYRQFEGYYWFLAKLQEPIMANWLLITTVASATGGVRLGKLDSNTEKVPSLSPGRGILTSKSASTKLDSKASQIRRKDANELPSFFTLNCCKSFRHIFRKKLHVHGVTYHEYRWQLD